MTKPLVTIYTDGACDPNPGPGGWAATLRYCGHEKVLTGREASTTSNRMELRAAICALEALHVPTRVELYTDSEYLKRGITEWLPKWIAHAWRKSDKKPVLNVDLWQTLHALTLRHEVEWRWVRGHSGDPHNERVDRLAHRAIRVPQGMREGSPAEGASHVQ
jgi:ribonuclease HI